MRLRALLSAFLLVMGVGFVTPDSSSAAPAPVVVTEAAPAGSCVGSCDASGGIGGGGNTNCTGTSCASDYRCMPDQSGYDTTYKKKTYLPVFPPCYGYTYWKPTVRDCLVRYEVWRFYGTVSDPVKGGTTSEVYYQDPCANRGANNSVSVAARLYFPQQVDASTGVQPQAFYHKTAAREIVMDGKSYGRWVIGSNDCANGMSIGGASARACKPTTNTPEVRFGQNGSVNSKQTCAAIRPSAAVSAATALRSTNPTVVAKAQRDIFGVYEAMRALTRSSDHAAVWAGLKIKPITPENITAATLNDAPCNSIVDFMAYRAPAAAASTAEPRVIGTCVAAVSRPARMFAYGDNPSDNDLRPGWFDTKDKNQSNMGERYSENLKPSDIRMSSQLDGTVTTANMKGAGLTTQDDKYDAAYASAITREVNARSSKPDVAFWPARFTDRSDFNKQAIAFDNRTSLSPGQSAARNAVCFAVEVAPELPSSACDDTNSCPTETTYTSGPEPELRITATMPAVLRVGGTLRPGAVKTTGLALYCNGQLCGANDVDPDLVSAAFKYSLTSNSPKYRRCASMRSRNCEYFVTTSGSGATTGASAYLFSPTNKGELLRLAAEGVSFTYKARTKVTTCTLWDLKPKTCTSVITEMNTAGTKHSFSASPSSAPVVGAVGR